MLVTIQNNISYGDCPFNPQVMLATSGSENAGIDNSSFYGVFRFYFPL